MNKIMENRKTGAIIKVSVIGILGALFSFLTFYFFNSFIIAFDFSFLWLTLLFTVFFLTFYVLQSFFVKDSVVLLGFSFLQGVVPLIVFYPYIQSDSFWYLMGTGLAIYIGFLIAGSKQGLSSIDNSVEIKFFSIAENVAKAFIGLLIVLMVFSYFHMFHLDNFSDENGQALFDRMLASVEPALKIWFPGVTFDMTVDDALERMTNVQIERSKIDLLQEGINFEELPREAQQEMINNAQDQIQLTLENLTGKSITPDQALNVYLFESLNQWLSSFSDATRIFFEIGSFVFLFFIIKGLSFIIYVPVKFIAFLFYKFLTLIGFADITIRQVSKEEIIL